MYFYKRQKKNLVIKSLRMKDRIYIRTHNVVLKKSKRASLKM